MTVVAPHHALVRLTPLGSKDRKASRYAVKQDGSGKGEGRASTDPPPKDEKGTDGSGTKTDSKGGSSAKGESDQKSGGKSGHFVAELPG